MTFERGCMDTKWNTGIKLMIKLIKQRIMKKIMKKSKKKGQREEGQGGKRIDRRMDRSRKIGAKHTHIHIHTIFILKNEDRIKSDDCRRESKPTSSEHMRRSIVNNRTRTRRTQSLSSWFSALKRSTSPMRIERESKKCEGKGEEELVWSFIENDVGEEGSTLNPILTRLSFHLAGPTFRLGDG